MGGLVDLGRRGCSYLVRWRCSRRVHRLRKARMTTGSARTWSRWNVGSPRSAGCPARTGSASSWAAIPGCPFRAPATFDWWESPS